jgi:phage terminase small subunit
MPNPGKTAEEKKRIGSREPIRESVIDIQQIQTWPEPMRRLEHSGLDLWKKAFVAGSTWLKDTDLDLLQITCEQMDERDSLRVYVLENMEAWHERAALRVLERDIQANLTQLGFTPTARQKLGIQEVKAASKLQQLMERNG